MISAPRTRCLKFLQQEHYQPAINITNIEDVPEHLVHDEHGVNTRLDNGKIGLECGKHLGLLTWHVCPTRCDVLCCKVIEDWRPYVRRFLISVTYVARFLLLSYHDDVGLERNALEVGSAHERRQGPHSIVARGAGEYSLLNSHIKSLL